MTHADSTHDEGHMLEVIATTNKFISESNEVQQALADGSIDIATITALASINVSWEHGVYLDDCREIGAVAAKLINNQ